MLEYQLATNQQLNMSIEADVQDSVYDGVRESLRENFERNRTLVMKWIENIGLDVMGMKKVAKYR